jgi:O-antigen ligase
VRTIAYLTSLLLVFAIPWENVVEHPLLGSAPRLVGMALTVFWLAKVVTTRNIRRPALFHVVAFAFVLWNIASALWSADAEITTYHLMTWIQIFLLLIILWDLYTTRDTVVNALQVYVLGSYVVIANTIINYTSGEAFYYQRFSATGTNPDDLGAVLALGIPVAWYLVQEKSGGRLSIFLTTINYAYIPAAFVGIALSGTRTALVAGALGMAYGLSSLSRLRPAVRVIMLVLMVSAGLMLVPRIPEASIDRLASTRAELVAGDLNGRIELWREGLAAFADHPILGFGGEMYRNVNVEGKVAHNSFLSVLVELGIIGFVLFGATIAVAVLKIRRLPQSDARFWISVFAAWVIIASTLSWEHKKPTWLFLSLLVSTAALFPRYDETPNLLSPIHLKRGGRAS